MLALTTGLMLATTLFEANWNDPLASSSQWNLPHAATFGWDAVGQLTNFTPRVNLATRSTSAMFMAGSNIQAAYKGRSLATGTQGGGYSVSVTWSPGYIAPMDEDVTIALCNLDPNGLTVESANAMRDASGQSFNMLAPACIGAEISDETGSFDLASAVARACPRARSLCGKGAQHPLKLRESYRYM